MATIIELLEEDNIDFSFFYKQLKLSNELDYQCFILQNKGVKKKNIYRNNEHFIPLIKFENTDSTNKTRENIILDFSKGIARFMSSFINEHNDVVLIINNPKHLLIAQYLKERYNLKLVITVDKSHEDYLTELSVEASKESLKEKEINKMFILADKVIYTTDSVKTLLLNTLKLYPKNLCFFDSSPLEEKEFLPVFLEKFRREEFLPDYKKLKKYEFHKNAKTILFLVKEIIEELNIPYWIDYGTLLGAIRENGFIEHDYDIDIGLFESDLSPLLEKKLILNGFKKRYQYRLEDTNILSEQTYSFNNINVDFFLYQKSENNIIGHYFHAETSFELAMREKGWLDTYEVIFNFHGIGSCDFLGNSFPIPSNPINYLKQHYGEDFMIPDANWDYIKKPFNVKKVNLRGIMESYNSMN